MSQPETTEDPVECDLPGCPMAVDFEPDDEVWPPEPPPGDWVSVLVGRNGAHNITRTYCSAAHAAEGVASHLPEPVLRVEEPSRWWDDLVVGASILGLIACFLLGAVTAAVLLWQAAGWVVDRL